MQRYTRVPAIAVWTAVLAAAGLSVAGAQGTAPGTSVMLHTVSTPTGAGAMANAMAAMRQDWTAVIVEAAGRERMDIVDGNAQQIMSKGDYLLSEGADYIIVHPTTKTFVAIPTDMGTQSADMMSASGMSMTIKDVRVTIDTLADGDSIAGRATRHFRIQSSYAMVMDLGSLGDALRGAAPPTMATTMTTEYWIATTGDVFPNSPMAAGGSAAATRMMGGLGVSMKELTDKMAAATAALPTGTPLRTRTTTQVDGGPMMGSGGGQSQADMSDIKKVSVDLTQLVLPAGYTQAQFPGMDQLPNPPAIPADGGAKWRVLPRGPGGSPR